MKTFYSHWYQFIGKWYVTNSHDMVECFLRKSRNGTYYYCLSGELPSYLHQPFELRPTLDKRDVERYIKMGLLSIQEDGTIRSNKWAGQKRRYSSSIPRYRCCGSADLGVKKDSRRRKYKERMDLRYAYHGKNPGKELNKPYIEPPEEPERAGHPIRKFDLKQKRKQCGYRRAYSKRNPEENY